MGYSNEWIENRLKSILDRNKLTDALTDLGEIATRELTKCHQPYGLEQNKKITKAGGEVVKLAVMI